MGILSKDDYDRRRENAAKRARDNAERCQTLTAEQHEFLEWLCQFRHELHCAQAALFHTEWAEYRRFWETLEKLGDIAQVVGFALPNYDRTDLPDDYYWNDDIIVEEDGTRHEKGLEANTEEWDAKFQAAEKIVLNYAEKINNDIEHFLCSVDEEHNTNYAPTGHQRLL